MEDKKSVPVKITTHRKDGGTRTYANYVRVSASPFDVTLQFADVKPGANDEEQEKLKRDRKAEALIDVEIVLPVDVAKSFAEILKKQLDIVKVSSDKSKK